MRVPTEFAFACFSGTALIRTDMGNVDGSVPLIGGDAAGVSMSASAIPRVVGSVRLRQVDRLVVSVTCESGDAHVR